jgi:hypothetical protein
MVSEWEEVIIRAKTSPEDFTRQAVIKVGNITKNSQIVELERLVKEYSSAAEELEKTGDVEETQVKYHLSRDYITKDLIPTILEGLQQALDSFDGPIVDKVNEFNQMLLELEDDPEVFTQKIVPFLRNEYDKWMTTEGGITIPEHDVGLAKAKEYFESKIVINNRDEIISSLAALAMKPETNTTYWRKLINIIPDKYNITRQTILTGERKRKYQMVPKERFDEAILSPHTDRRKFRKLLSNLQTARFLSGSIGKFLQKAERGDRGLEIDSPFFMLYNIVKENFKTNLFGRATQGALLGRAEHVGEETGNYRRIFRNFAQDYIAANPEEIIDEEQIRERAGLPLGAPTSLREQFYRWQTDPQFKLGPAGKERVLVDDEGKKRVKENIPTMADIYGDVRFAQRVPLDRFLSTRVKITDMDVGEIFKICLPPSNQMDDNIRELRVDSFPEKFSEADAYIILSAYIYIIDTFNPTNIDGLLTDLAKIRDEMLSLTYQTSRDKRRGRPPRPVFTYSDNGKLQEYFDELEQSDVSTIIQQIENFLVRLKNELEQTSGAILESLYGDIQKNLNKDGQGLFKIPTIRERREGDKRRKGGKRTGKPDPEGVETKSRTQGTIQEYLLNYNVKDGSQTEYNIIGVA